LLLLQTILDPSFPHVEKKGLIPGNWSLSIFQTLGLQTWNIKMKSDNNMLNVLVTLSWKLTPAMKAIRPIDHDRHMNNSRFRITLNLEFVYIFTIRCMKLTCYQIIPLIFTSNIGHLRRIDTSLAKLDPGPNNHDIVCSDHDN